MNSSALLAILLAVVLLGSTVPLEAVPAPSLDREQPDDVGLDRAQVDLGTTPFHAMDQAESEPIPIDSCGDIDTSILVEDNPGRTFVLTSDVDASEVEGNEQCFNVESSRITILGNGHTIRGNGTGIGIYVANTHSEIRNVTVAGFETGILIEAEGTLVISNSTVTNNSDFGVDTDILEGQAVIRRSTISDNGVGVGGIWSITDSRIVDNEGHGLVADEPGGVVTRSVIAGNGGNGVHQAPGIPPHFSNVDARYNFWGAADGPSSDPAHPPLADPVTGVLANGSGDRVPPHFDDHPPANTTPSRPNVSNVRFDPFLVAPLGQSTYDGHYQVDLVLDDPIPQLADDRLYSDEGRLVWFLHGKGDTVVRTGTPPTLDQAAADCFDVVSWTVVNDTATVEVAANDDQDCRVRLTLVSYENPGAGFSRDTADEQQLFDFQQRTIAAGATRTYTVDLPPVPNG